MHVKGQLRDAQLERFTTAGRPAAGKVGRKIYDTDLEIELIDTGSAWVGSFDNLQSQFDGQSAAQQGEWRSKMHAVGDTISSFLTEAQFQIEYDNKWVLCDGRSASGTDYETVTGNSNIPDARGLFLRGKNNGRSDGNQNPGGDLAIGTYQADEVGPHNHPIQGYANNQGNMTAFDSLGVRGGPSGTWNTNNNSGAESRPRNMTVNHFIKINR